MKFKDGKTFSAYVRSKLHSGYITTTHKLRARYNDVSFQKKVCSVGFNAELREQTRSILCLQQLSP